MVAEYLASSTVDVNDTVQFVNLSYPEPYRARWEFGDGNTSSEAQPDHIYLSPGDYTVRLYIENEYCTAVLEKVITVAPLRQAIPDEPEVLFLEVSSLKLYPNPVEDIVNYSLKLTKSAKVEVRVISLQGNVVHTETRQGKEIANSIDLSRLPGGVYAVQFIVGKKRIVKRIVKW